MNVFVSLLLLLLTAPLSFHQNNDPLVLNVTVTTKKGTVIRDLTLENFSITSDKQPQKILSLANREVPASIGILIDTSGSQRGGRDPEIQQPFKQGLEGFFRKSNPENEYFALAFNSKITLVQDWTSDYQSILEKFDSLTFGKQTSMYDALRSGIEKMNESRNSKHVLIVISDGADNNSKTSFKEVRDVLKGSDVVLYSVGLNYMTGIADLVVPFNEEGGGVLSELTSLSGGRVLFMNDTQAPKAFNEVFELIAVELRSQYQLVIAPEPTSGKSKWHKLKVTASRSGTKSDSEELIARTRQGYYR
jgi:Ca-activated chloride channel family protein